MFVQEMIEISTEASRSGDFTSAEQSLAMLVQIAGENDPLVALANLWQMKPDSALGQVSR